MESTKTPNQVRGTKGSKFEGKKGNILPGKGGLGIRWEDGSITVFGKGDLWQLEIND